MGQKNKNSQIAQLGLSYTLTASYANVTGLVFTCLKTAKYRMLAVVTFEGAVSGDDCTIKLAIDGNNIDCTGTLTQDDGSTEKSMSTSIGNVYIKKGQVVSLRARYNVDGGNIKYSSAEGANGFIQIVEE